jgi:outer membrane protein assembly factor BamB
VRNKLIAALSASIVLLLVGMRLWLWLQDPFRNAPVARSVPIWSFNGKWNRTDVVGGTMWSFSLPDKGLVYSDDHNTYVLDGYGSRELPDFDINSAFIPDDAHGFYVGQFEAGLYRIDGQGRVIWHRPSLAKARGYEIYARWNGGVYALRQGEFSCISGTGRTVRTIHLNPVTNPLKALEVDGKLVFIDEREGDWLLKCMSDTGSSFWECPLEKAVHNNEYAAELLPLGVAKILYVAPGKGWFAFDVRDGNALWNRRTASTCLSDTLTMGDGRVVCWFEDSLVFLDSDGQ